MTIPYSIVTIDTTISSVYHSIMEVKKTYRLKLYPRKYQEEKLRKTFGACRFVWNYFLNERKTAYLERGEKMYYHETAMALTKLKQQDEYKWIGEAQTHPLQQSLRDLDAAYKNFFEKRANYPKFKSKYNPNQSFRKPDRWRINGKKLHIERGLSIYFKGNPPPKDNKNYSVTIKVDACGDWWATIVSEEEMKEPRGKKKDPIGLDLGLTHLAITSDGKKYENIHPKKSLKKEMKKIQQGLSRKQKGSKSRTVAKLKVARLHKKIKNTRSNHLHHISKKLANKNHVVIVCEDLAVSNMMKNHCLAESIGDASWSEFIRQLEYKQKWRGNSVEKVGRFFPSSKTCSQCNFVCQSLPLSIRQWECPKCSTKHDRDINAAKMVLKHWLGANQDAEGGDGSTALRDCVRVTRPVKRRVPQTIC